MNWKTNGFLPMRNICYKYHGGILYNISKFPQSWGMKVHKAKRRIPIYPLCKEKSFCDIARHLQTIKKSIHNQGNKIRNMKEDGAHEDDINREIFILQECKEILEKFISKLHPVEYFDRARMNDLLRRKFIYDISFSLYGGVGGQCDFGPLGCSIIDNILAEWHKHFVLKDQMLKVKCSVLTPEIALKASGHIEKFADFMVKDADTGECFRMDHVIKQFLEDKIQNKSTSEETRNILKRKLTTMDGLNLDEMGSIIKEFNIKSHAGNDLVDAAEFNLMFPISIGPIRSLKGFLRPETAQGIFVNFKKLYNYNQRRIPMICAQVGTAFRNEISPKSGLLRLREFILAEIEHFCFPDDKDHHKFFEVEDTLVWLLSAHSQVDEKSETYIKIGEAVRQGMIANETLGYYMARIQMFMISIGIDPAKLRFRQHMKNEMAHYACNCWDAECLTSYGWIECVGCADRSAYDLTQHSKATGVKLVVERPVSKPYIGERVTPVVNKESISRVFPDEFQNIIELINSMDTEEMVTMEESLSSSGVYKLVGKYSLNRSMVPRLKKEMKEIKVEEVIPSVIEPSFGMGRILYCLLEHTFRIREDDEKRCYFALPPSIAPIKVVLLPLVPRPQFKPFIEKLANALTTFNLVFKSDDTKDSIGRRYTRADEQCIPFAITVDFDTIKKLPSTITLRERNSALQVRIPVETAADVIKKLSDASTTWSDVLNRWPKFVFEENVDES